MEPLQYTRDFAAGLLVLARSKQCDVYNQVCEGSASRYDVADEFVRLLSLSEKVRIEKVPSSFFSEDYFSPGK